MTTEDIDASLGAKWRVWKYLPVESETYEGDYRWSREVTDAKSHYYTYDGVSDYKVVAGMDVTFVGAVSGISSFSAVILSSLALLYGSVF